jgi:serine/threonine protein kinase
VVRDVKTNLLWALKVPKKRSYNEMFRNEAETMNKIVHPHILALRDAFEVPPSSSPSYPPSLVCTMFSWRHCGFPCYGGRYTGLLRRHSY